MAKTLEKTTKYMEEHGPNELHTGRKTAYSIVDIINQGQGKMFSGDNTGQEDSTAEGDEMGNITIEPEDLLVE
jgi:hypothetical protein